jgi:6-pyruvoyltetrahydropterin/6-carboxytetrahydropterin synthase
MYNLHVEREIAISHQLKQHEGKCSNLHGHNLKVIVDIKASDLIKDGSSKNMVMDFGDIKKQIDWLDHQHINNVLSEQQPTAEYLCKYLVDTLYCQSNNDSITEISVTIYEATGQYAQYTA